MVASAVGRVLVEAHRVQQVQLGRRATLHLLALFPLWDFTRLDESWVPFKQALLSVVENLFNVSAQRAGAFYRTLRLLEGHPGEVVPILPTWDRANADANLELLGIILAKKAISSRRPRVEQVSMVRLASGVQRLTMNGGRETLQETMRADRRIRGYRRVLSGGGCEWCRTLADRGVISKAEPFPAHSGCGCTSEPVFVGES